MATQLLILSVKKQASGALIILFQNETELKQITSNEASGAGLSCRVPIYRARSADYEVYRARSAMFCHPERSEGSITMGIQMLRGVYPERSEGLSMTGLDLSVDDELSSAFEPCFRK
jgi:hypothetical protein